MNEAPPAAPPEIAPGLVLLHADARLVVVDKPAGLLVHPSALDAHEADTALGRLQSATGRRWWTVHRLDKGTSGALVFAADADAARALGAAFETPGAVAKRYLALVRGWPADAGVCEHPLARDPERPSAGQPLRESRTRWRVLRRLEWPFAVDARHATSRYALVEARPETGRRHQIRRHFKHLGHPLVGDATHGKGPHNRAVAAWLGTNRLWLHAAAIELPHPDGGRLAVDAATGEEWSRLVEAPGRQRGSRGADAPPAAPPVPGSARHESASPTSPSTSNSDESAASPPRSNAAPPTAGPTAVPAE